MHLENMMPLFSWHYYSKKLRRYIDAPDHVGTLEKEGNLRLVTGKYGSVEEGNILIIYWLISEEDGVIKKARFQAFGQSALIGAAEAASELVIGKNYDQARRMSADIIDQYLRDKGDIPAFPEETFAHLNFVICTIDEVAEQCGDIPFADTYVATPIDPTTNLEQREYPGWKELTIPQKTTIIEEVIANEIRPFVELDAGGVEIVEVTKDDQVTIRYKGNCTTCYSAIGGTLSAITRIMQTRISPTITVVPDMSSLEF